MRLLCTCPCERLVACMLITLFFGASPSGSRQFKVIIQRSSSLEVINSQEPIQYGRFPVLRPNFPFLPSWHRNTTCILPLPPLHDWQIASQVSRLDTIARNPFVFWRRKRKAIDIFQYQALLCLPSFIEEKRNCPLRLGT